MITTTLAELLDAETALAALEQLQLPVKTAYHVAKLTRLVTVETKLFKERRDALIKDLGAERETTDAERAGGAGPTTTQVTPKNWDTYIARVNELGAIAVEIAWRPLTLTELEGATTGSGPMDNRTQVPTQVRAADLRRLGPLLADEPDTPTLPAPTLPGRPTPIVD